MIAMLVSSPSDQEMEYICIYSKEMTGLFSDEGLEIYRSSKIKELQAETENIDKLDLICIDITVPHALEAVQMLRSRNETAYLILIAGMNISPVTYMKPSIHAESLILKPFQKEQAEDVLKEAFREILKRFQTPDSGKVFVVDNQEGRILIAYDTIYFFEARNKKIYLNTGTREYGFYGSIEHLQEQLSGQFLRCHRSFLVNKEKIERTVLSKNMLLLENAFEIPVSRTYRPVLKQLGGKEDGNIQL